MKPEFEVISTKATRSFSVKLVKRSKRPLLTQAWHYHPEIEICFTNKSVGNRYVGNNISDYQEKDLVILGPNLPHGFTTSVECEQYVLQFKNDFLGKDFFESAELQKIKCLIQRSKRGLILSGDEVKIAEEKIIALHDNKTSNFKSLLQFLDFLDFLSKCQNIEPICTEKYSTHMSVTKLNSIKSIFDFIENNFQMEITVTDACKVVNLTESAFYKFMNRHTHKKFTTILNEYRINHASKLLVSSDIPISDISYQSGYNNLSHFNRIFKKTYSMTPKQFRLSHQT